MRCGGFLTVYSGAMSRDPFNLDAVRRRKVALDAEYGTNKPAEQRRARRADWSSTTPWDEQARRETRVKVDQAEQIERERLALMRTAATRDLCARYLGAEPDAVTVDLNA